MITNRDVRELKKRMKTPEDCNIIRMKGAYVNAEKAIVTKIDERFMNLPEESIYKYLDIVKTPYQPEEIENKVLTLEFMDVRCAARNILQRIVESELKDTEAEHLLYQDIIENYAYPGNYLILLFYDVYDVPGKTKDRKLMDESEEVYSYITCCICPVNLQKPALQYEKNKNVFKPLEREWVVGKPMEAFVYPAFDNRSEDLDEIMYYCADAAHPAHEIMECVMECKPTLTATEHRELFEHSIKAAAGSEERSDKCLIKLNGVFDEYLLAESANYFAEQKRLDGRELLDVLKKTEYTDAEIEEVVDSYLKRYPNEEFPKVAWLLNKAYRRAYYENAAKDRVRDMLKRAAGSLENHGEKDSAQEIERYLESTR